MTQWKKTSDVLQWFKDLKNKERIKFIQFDICEFYTSITHTLLMKALEFAASLTELSTLEKETILQSRACYLYSEGYTWAKKKDEKFDVTMGAWDGAECCELVGLFLLKELRNQDIDAGLYRDDGIAVSSASPRQVEVLKKKICKVFSDNDLRITIEANKKSINFLDVTLDLSNCTYKPYMKENDVPQYVHCQSNHPPAIIKNLPLSINQRISSISVNEEIFMKAVKPYQEAIDKSGYNFKMRYEEQSTIAPSCRKRQRKIVWYNPPYSKNVKTNIGAKFLRLIEKHFPQGHKLHNIINRNTVKVSYRCLPNLSSIISSHNAKILRDSSQSVSEKLCNCRKKDECPLNGKCLTDKVVYRAAVKLNDEPKIEDYVGITGNSFKTRYNQHKSSFKQNNIQSTTLSQHVCKLRNKKADFNIDWSILKRASTFSTSTGRCNLCIAEKYIFLYRDDLGSLNSRDELTAKCMHMDGLLLDKT